ncbi:HNH endonuclease signature motif containing protein [Xanthomonas citri pv. glycines]|uniref:HNH endonuclease signature motif containing protein n=1 Tax=Xanthomonas TaxID=338 RepID=UPI001E43032D|nr:MULTISPECIES: HNH endonuclease signature motif containing protein [Xanthomonas]UIX74088.1 HNH endonuclease [Xanthomonas citri pv. glycines]WLA18999.1 HNH endonuclease [Xanthomonas citri pv. glycines]WLA28476.1 HNH endonuclease [Xanthomonas citri pv. glycines]
MGHDSDLSEAGSAAVPCGTARRIRKTLRSYRLQRRPRAEAAHILPYRGEHTNRVDNGLLLRSDIHTLFDLGLLWFEDLRLAVSAELNGTDYEAMHGTPLTLPRTAACHPNPEHLRHHARLARQRNGLDEAKK